ncbi:hypothetical protein [Mucilaginibacter dorajii]|uniref:Uncharacterized protein n=1 Tax=Mucilaginibacter dorajii TaxID=692994 RepID=A0ABP7Q5P5_9SPHI|nr:hypothetical protein [Mucilaginibacter dorajii]MCS3732544.1 hypothetical protein [Mucilaginibacter dorajii]
MLLAFVSVNYLQAGSNNQVGEGTELKYGYRNRVRMQWEIPASMQEFDVFKISQVAEDNINQASCKVLLIPHIADK